MATQRPPVERIGHRGAPRELPENTVPGFLRALERGADAVELDVHKTRDGVVVVHHDAAVRLVDGTTAAIADLALSEVTACPLPGGAQIPTLAEVMDALGDRATVYVELKGAGTGEPAVAVARAHGARYAFHSFDHGAIRALQARHADLACGFLFDEGGPDVRGQFDECPVRDLWPHYRLLDAAWIEAAHAAGKRVLGWTVNSPAVARRLAAWGIDGLCGDDVRLFRDVP